MEVLHGLGPQLVQNLHNFCDMVRSVQLDRYHVGAMTDEGKRELWQTADAARAAGWTTEMSERGHLILRAPHGGNLVLTGVASAHRRTAGNVHALVRRYGRIGA